MMTITLELSPELEVKAQSASKTSGLPVKEILQQALEQMPALPAPLPKLTANEQTTAEGLTAKEFTLCWSGLEEDIHPENLGLYIPLAAEGSLRKIWDTPEEDAAWLDLQKEGSVCFIAGIISVWKTTP